jgi:hypothetical protein
MQLLATIGAWNEHPENTNFAKFSFRSGGTALEVSISSPRAMISGASLRTAARTFDVS